LKKSIRPASGSSPLRRRPRTSTNRLDSPAFLVLVGAKNLALSAAKHFLNGLLAAATAAEAQLTAAARQHVEAALTDSQRTLWSTIRANPASG
jgi:hypothetical protein